MEEQVYIEEISVPEGIQMIPYSDGENIKYRLEDEDGAELFTGDSPEEVIEWINKR